MLINKNILLLSFIFILAACSSGSRYSQRHDSIPDRLPEMDELHEPIPKVVKPSRGGNKNYQVFGKNYTVMKSAENYTATGVSSWYGNKFHGHLTSNGEIYDMYAFSAAHKSLPLPTYLQVTNLANNKKVIVRVNDRGPFHGNRLIDLSYSAAYKLGFLKQGTANVKIEAITESNLANFINTNESALIANKPAISKPLVEQAKKTIKKPVKVVTKTTPTVNTNFNQYIHVLVTRDNVLANSTAKALNFLMQVPVNLTENNELFRVQLGPIDSEAEAKASLRDLQHQGYPEAYSLKSLK